MKKLLALLLTCTLLLTAFSAAWAEAAEEAVPAEETPQLTYDYDELTVAVTTPLTGNFFTSMWGNGSSDLDVRSLIHGYNLVEWDTEQGVFVPDQSVVSGVTVQAETNGNMTFIIALYGDLFYSDGTQVTAWDYAFSILLTMAPEMKELGAAVRTPEYIAGYNDYISGKTNRLSGVRVMTDRVIRITIDKKYLPFFYELGLLDCVPYPIAAIAPGVKVADNGNGVYLTNADAGNDTPVFTADLLKGTILDEATGYRTHPSVTSGPYLLTSYEDGVAKFEINPRYKGDSKGQKPTIPRIIMKSMDSDEMTPAFKDGSVTLLNKVSDAQTISDCLDLMGEQEILSFANYPRSGLSFLSFNVDRAPLDDFAVREAIAYAADRDAIVKGTLGDYGLKGLGYFGMGQWMYLLLNGTVSPVPIPDEKADAKTIAEYEEKMKQWAALSLDDIEPYDMNTEKAGELLDGAGWNLNEKGETYTPGTDGIRYKKTEDGLVPLQLTMAYSQGSAAGESLEGALVESLAKAGIELKVEAIPADDLFNEYYRLADEQYDILFLATNFDVLYDPSLSFIETEDGHHVWKTSGLEDDDLWEIAVDMRHTEPEDILGYCTKWLKFQVRIMEQLPVLPVYSNVYFDFYPLVLHDYKIAANVSWPQAINEAYMADYIPPETPETPEITETAEETEP